MLLIFALAFLSTVFADCVVDIRTQLNINEPSFFDPANEAALWLPKNFQLKWKEGEASVISCSTSETVAQLMIAKKEYNNAVTTITCVSGDRFKTGLTGDAIVKSRELSCKLTNFGNVRSTKEKCGEQNAGRILEIGFANGEYFSPIIRSCFENATSSIRYASHHIYGDSLSFMQQNQPFREAGTNLELNLYSKNHQLTRYQELLSNNIGPLYFEPAGKGNFLAKGQLAPNEDAVFNNWGRAAFSLANVIPQWQSNNAGNWALLERKIRMLAIENKETFSIVTGAHGVSQLPNQDDKLVDMYLGKEPGGLAIPKWIWKIVQSAETNDAIMFVLLNEVHLDGEPQIQAPCQDVCNANKWVNYKENHIRGVIFCCNVNDVSWIKDVLPAFNYSGTALQFKFKTTVE